MTRRQLMTLTAVFFGIATIIVLGFVVYRSMYSATINLYFAPKSATVKIGSGGGVFGDNYVKPGTYKVVISKKGFTTYTKEVTVKSGEKVTINAALTSTSAETADWYSTHTEDYTIAQNIGDTKADAEMDAFVKDFPIVKILPIVGMYESYRVDYGTSPTKSGKYAVFVSYQSDAAKQQAIDAVTAKGYDLAKYEVIYELSAPKSGSTTFVNTVSLTSRGLSGDVLQKVQDLLSARYPSTTVTFADGAKHSIQNDGVSHIYSVNMTVGGSTQLLTITVNAMTDIQVVVGGQTIYTGSIT